MLASLAMLLSFAVPVAAQTPVVEEPEMPELDQYSEGYPPAEEEMMIAAQAAGNAVRDYVVEQGGSEVVSGVVAYNEALRAAREAGVDETTANFVATEAVSDVFEEEGIEPGLAFDREAREQESPVPATTDPTRPPNSNGDTPDEEASERAAAERGTGDQESSGAASSGRRADDRGTDDRDDGRETGNREDANRTNEERVADGREAEDRESTGREVADRGASGTASESTVAADRESAGSPGSAEEGPEMAVVSAVGAVPWFALGGGVLVVGGLLARRLLR